MKFCVSALQHNAGEVREKAERIIIMLYKVSAAARASVVGQT